VHQHAAEPLLDAQCLEQELALGWGDVDVSGHQVGEPARLVHAGEHLLHHLVRQAGLLAQLRCPGPGLAVQGDEGRILGVEREHLFRLTHDGLEIALFFGVVDGDAAVLAVEQQLHAGETPLKLPDLGDSADRVQHIGVDALDVLPLAHGEHEALRGRERRLDGPEGRRSPGADRGRDPGKQYHLAQREHRQSQSFGHVETTPSKSPFVGEENDVPQDRELRSTERAMHARDLPCASKQLTGPPGFRRRSGRQDRRKIGGGRCQFDGHRRP